QQQPDDVATELELVERALFAEAEQADREGTREPAGIGRPDRRAQGVVVDGVIALEGKPADYPLLLLLRGEGSRRENGDEQGQTERAQLTQSGCIPMLATSPRTVNLFDSVGLHPYVGYLPPHCQPFRHLTTCAHSWVLPSSASPQPRPAGGNARAPGVEASPITNPTTHARSIPPSRPTCRRVRW